MAGALILIYNLPEQQRTILRFICAGMRIAVRTVSKEDYAQPLSALSGASKRVEETYTGDGFSEPMLVMANFTSEQFYALMDALRRNRVFIALKAVLTPTNAAWNSVRLHEELLREHEAMRKKD